MIEIGQVRQVNDANYNKSSVGKKFVIKSITTYGGGLGETPMEWAVCLLEDGTMEEIATVTLEKVTDLL